MIKNSRIAIVAGLALAALVVGTLPAQAQTTVQVTATWTAPSTGSPVHHYVVQLSTNGGAYQSAGTSTTTSITLTLTVGSTYTVRVAGVDAQSRQGVYSQASDPYTPDLGPPGQPGKPVVI
jgi:glyoxylate utilization-related uncharacterized protein